jgi:hypothetical protein
VEWDESPADTAARYKGFVRSLILEGLGAVPAAAPPNRKQ